MKKIALAILGILLFSSCFAPIQITEENREIHNFQVNNGVISWSYIYDAASDIEDVKSWFEENFIISQNKGDKIIGKTEENTIPYKRVGYSSGNVLLLFQHPCEVYFTALFKDNRYKVIVERISWNATLNGTRVTSSLQEVAFKDGGYNPAFVNYAGEQLDKCLYHIFDARITNEEDIDW